MPLHLIFLRHLFAFSYAHCHCYFVSIYDHRKTAQLPTATATLAREVTAISTFVTIYATTAIH